VAQHPAVAQCAIIGIPNESWGEEVYAIVIRRLDTKVDPVDIIAFCKERIAHYNCPRGVDIRDEPLPMSGLSANCERHSGRAESGRSAERWHVSDVPRLALRFGVGRTSRFHRGSANGRNGVTP
jgi:hypothetical protein